MLEAEIGLSSPGPWSRAFELYLHICLGDVEVEECSRSYVPEDLFRQLQCSRGHPD